MAKPRPRSEGLRLEDFVGLFKEEGPPRELPPGFHRRNFLGALVTPAIMLAIGAYTRYTQNEQAQVRRGPE